MVFIGRCYRPCFDPQALTSLTDASSFANGVVEWFRSTGSYEPDPPVSWDMDYPIGFDPQALTSLTIGKTSNGLMISTFRSTGSYEPDLFR